MIFKVLTFCFLSSSLIAGDHSLTNVKGPGVDLKMYDHAIAGSIKDFVIFGNVDEATFTSHLVMKRDEQLVRATFLKEQSRIGGTISHSTKNENRVTDITFQTIVKDQNIFIFSVNGSEMKVKVHFDDFKNNHFINPTYVADYKGVSYWFKIENGQACYSFSAHLIMLIFGSLLH